LACAICAGTWFEWSIGSAPSYGPMSPLLMLAPEQANERKVKLISGNWSISALTAIGAVARGERWQRRAPSVPDSASPVKARSALEPDHTARRSGSSSGVPSAL
jgi:hypothetical protein